MKSHTFHPEADAEYAEAARFYGEIRPELGVRFFDEIQFIITAVCTRPRQFHEFDPPLRRCLARGFPYGIVYLNEPEQVWIVAVMHLHRRPGYLQERLG